VKEAKAVVLHAASLKSKFERMTTMNNKRRNSRKQTMRHVVALMVSMLVIPALQVNLYAEDQTPAYVELNAEQLDQLVAPIALDPDSLVAQVLTAATFPDQVVAANAWLKQNMDLQPDERATAADNMSWDDSVKGLTAFPSTLENLAKNKGWTTELGNAYYNQPGDVMNAVQAMREQAKDSNKLVTTAQQKVAVDADGAITITPVNVAAVYVPYYNPWAIWGTLFVAYPGYVVLPPPVGYVVGVGLAFDPPVAVGVYAAGFDWGFANWGPAWGVGTINYGGNTYISNSVTVINHGRFGYHDHDAFARGGRGVPRGFHGFAHAGVAREAGRRAGLEHGRLDARRHDTGHFDHGRTGRPDGHHDPVSRTGYHGPSGKPLPGHSSPSKPAPSKPSPSKPTPGHGTTSGKPTGSHPTPGTNHSGYGSGHTTSGSGNHGTTTTKRTSTPNRSTTAANHTSNATHNTTTNHATPAANHTANAGHTAAPASHTAANVGHAAAAGGGHAAGGKGRGR
jgi:hypothetical protein